MIKRRIAACPARIASTDLTSRRVSSAVSEPLADKGDDDACG
jgi:hypothetical protein